MDIRILPSNVANMIAAGEVVQRPASVVKELMENSVDAGADQVTVVIQDAGRTLIQVIDNGCGMSPDEAVLCFERHATSKLYSPEDLHKILTFGLCKEVVALNCLSLFYNSTCNCLHLSESCVSLSKICLDLSVVVSCPELEGSSSLEKLSYTLWLLNTWELDEDTSAVSELLDVR